MKVWLIGLFLMVLVSFAWAEDTLPACGQDVDVPSSYYKGGVLTPTDPPVPSTPHFKVIAIGHDIFLVEE
jgi:hypothetical protein